MRHGETKETLGTGKIFPCGCRANAPVLRAGPSNEGLRVQVGQPPEEELSGEPELV